MSSSNINSLIHALKSEYIYGYLMKDLKLLNKFLSFESHLQDDINEGYLKDILYHPFTDKNQLVLITKKAEKLAKSKNEITIFYKSLKINSQPVNINNIVLTPYNNIKIDLEYGNYLVDYTWINHLDNDGKHNHSFIVIFTDTHNLIYKLSDYSQKLSNTTKDHFDLANLNLSFAKLVYAKEFSKNKRLNKHSIVVSCTKNSSMPAFKYISDNDIPWRKEESLPFNIQSEKYNIIHRGCEFNDERSLQEILKEFPLKFLALESLGHHSWWKDKKNPENTKITIDCEIDENKPQNLSISFDKDIWFEICDINVFQVFPKCLDNLTDLKSNPLVNDLWMFLRIYKQLNNIFEYLKKVTSELGKHQHSIEKFWKSTKSHYSPNEEADLLADLIRYMSTGVCVDNLKNWFSKYFDLKHMKKYQRLLNDFYFKPVEIQAFYLAIDILLDNLFVLNSFLKCNTAFLELLNEFNSVDILLQLTDLRNTIYDMFKTDKTDSKMTIGEMSRLQKADQEQHLMFYNWIAGVADHIEKSKKTTLEPLNITVKEQFKIISFMSLLKMKMETLSKKSVLAKSQYTGCDIKTGFNSMNYFIIQAAKVVEDSATNSLFNAVDNSISEIVRELIIPNK
ncbi:hypothetical protein QEN19_002086 [Hanseniaspora menglaensis]